MDVDGKCRWNDWTENHDMLSQQKKSLGRTWSWKKQQFDGRSCSTGTGKTCRTCRRVRPSPDLMEIEVFSDFWLSSTKSKLINNQFFWNNFSTKKKSFVNLFKSQSTGIFVNLSRSTGQWTCFRLGLHEGASTTGWRPGHDWISNTCWNNGNKCIYTCIYYSLHITNIYIDCYTYTIIKVQWKYNIIQEIIVYGICIHILSFMYTLL